MISKIRRPQMTGASQHESYSKTVFVSTCSLEANLCTHLVIKIYC